MRFSLMPAALATLAAFSPRLTCANGYDEYPPDLAWGPDGGCLVYATGNGLFATKPGDAEPRRLAGPGAVHPVFNPGGGELVYVARGDLWKMDLAHADRPQQLTRLGDVDLPVFHPKGMAVFFSRGKRFYGMSLWRLGTDSNDAVQMTDTHPRPRAGHTPWSHLLPAFSPSGERCAFLSQGEPDQPGSYERIRVASSDLKESRLLTSDETEMHESYVSWLGNERLLFERGGWGWWNIYTVDAKGGAPRKIIDDGESPSVSADGKRVAFARRPKGDDTINEKPADIWMARVDGQEQIRLTMDPAHEYAPVWAPDGSKLAYRKVGSDSRETVHILTIPK